MRYLITGGAGFIGSNYARRLIQRGEQVTIYDNLSRYGAKLNLAWLQETLGERSFSFIHGDVRDGTSLAAALRHCDVVVHLASQVAVTTSVQQPREDFDVNVQGTFNVLEAARLAEQPPIVLFASTNKVYGGIESLIITEKDTRYAYRDYPYGIPESFPLDFHSPYGCSKGAGDQYVRDYSRVYNLPTVVFRQSCIYGPRQFGIEDQGWVAWFIIAAVLERPITIYGDGKQVRDVLYVEDLLDAYDAAIAHIDQTAGQIYNVGGGPEHQVSVWAEFCPLLESLVGHPISVKYDVWRTGDQRIYVSDIRKAARFLGWRPRFGVRAGMTRLYRWVVENQHLFSQ